MDTHYCGDRAYGVEAAAERCFSKHAKELRLTEAALLAGVVQDPGTTDPINFPDKALARRNVVLDRMHELKLISDKDWTDAKAVKLADILHPKAAQNSCQSSKYPYFCDYVIAYLKQDPSLDAALGTSEKERINAIYRGGLTIQTTLDPPSSDLAREKLVERVPVGDGRHRRGHGGHRREDRGGQGDRSEHRVQAQLQPTIERPRSTGRSTPSTAGRWASASGPPSRPSPS